MVRWQRAALTEGQLPRQKQPRNVPLARALRQQMSLPEVLLRQELRGMPEGVKFRRQHPLGPYVLDFYCAEAKVCVEIDGLSHDMGNRPERDDVRDRYLAGLEIRVLRIAASEVLKSPVATADAIIRLCRKE